MEEKLFNSLEVAKTLYVEPLDQFRFDVSIRPNNQYVVNLDDNTCTCRQFELENFPCAYAVTIALHRGISAHVLCSQYYTIDFWKAAYSITIFSMLNEVEWKVPDHISSSLNNFPPLVNRRSGSNLHQEYHLLESVLAVVGMIDVVLELNCSNQVPTCILYSKMYCMYCMMFILGLR
ncbi:zinc finger protein [Abeliophyllum distichum]|uniref:Zinc finger protein n=1 Tax=Abeliophyllum distichum TaxID=126358 RepID=A0ABD1PQU9_9LAMI